MMEEFQEEVFPRKRYSKDSEFEIRYNDFKVQDKRKFNHSILNNLT